jgi:hypothetical protein
MTVTEEHQIPSALLIGLRRVEPCLTGLGGLDMTDLSDEDAVAVDQDLVACRETRRAGQGE